MGYVSTQIWDFSNICISWGNSCTILCYTRYRVSFYLWLIESILKHCKVPKYYKQDCRFSSKGKYNLFNSFQFIQPISCHWSLFIPPPPPTASKTIIRLKVRDSHLTCKVANKCLNVHEQVEVVEWNKQWSPPFPCCPVNRQCLWKKTLVEIPNPLF